MGSKHIVIVTDYNPVVLEDALLTWASEARKSFFKHLDCHADPNRPIVGLTEAILRYSFPFENSRNFRDYRLESDITRLHKQINDCLIGFPEGATSLPSTARRSAEVIVLFEDVDPRIAELVQCSYGKATPLYESLSEIFS